MDIQDKTVDTEHKAYVYRRVAELLPIFELLATYKAEKRKRGIKKDNIPGWQQLAVAEAQLLKSTYPDNGKEIHLYYGTCLKQITSLKKYLRIAAETELKDPGLFNPVKNVIKNFGDALSFLFSEYKELRNIHYREEVEKRRLPENRVQIDLTNSLKYAYTVLTEVAEGKNPYWIDVSCALALATGRRMAEIHCSAIFEHSDEYEITFRGQLKGKKRTVVIGDKSIPLRNVTFFIPTLLPAELVCLGLDYLEDNNKRLSRQEDPEYVNSRWSKSINERVKEWDIFPEDQRTYHKFRAAYLRACIVNEPDLDPFDFADFAKDILGDNDETTLNSYKRYELAPNSLSKI